MTVRLLALACSLSLACTVHAADVALRIQADGPLTPVSRLMTGACLEDVNHEIYGGLYSQMVYDESFGEPASTPADHVSGMWRPVQTGSARGSFAIDTARPLLGPQSQQINFDGGSGTIGIDNRGLKRWGIHFATGRLYEGCVWARAEAPATLYVTAQDGNRVLAEARLLVGSGRWTRYTFAITPNGETPSGRLVLALRQPGSLEIGYVLLQPGEWGRFADQPVRRDLAEAMQATGFTVVRYGGSMVNAAQYRWKNMIGPRDQRHPYTGYWCAHSTNGFGIPDVMNFTESAGFTVVPDFSADETPADMADFLEYANGTATTVWGKHRVDDGHPAPYGLHYLEFGNEEKVDEVYARKFMPAAAAMWAKDPNITLVVGDFEYKRPITDPNHVEGAHVDTLAGHKMILDWARTHGRRVWFDVHIWNDGPADPDVHLDALKSLDAALAKLSPGADFKFCVFEENANHHGLGRAIAHAKTVTALEQMGDRVAIVCAANTLQPDQQNDNGWDQGLIFFNPTHAWLQPPALVTQMLSAAYEPSCATVDGVPDGLCANALVGSEQIALQVTNVSDDDTAATVRIDGRQLHTATATQLTGEWDETNSGDAPNHVKARSPGVAVGNDGTVRVTFPPRSFTVLKLK